ADLSIWLYSNWYHQDFPAWRAGARPHFTPLDLRKVANQTSHPTGAEILDTGRLPALDLRYVPTGEHVLAGVPFNIIDPAQNDDKAILVVGRPPSPIPKTLVPGIAEQAGPIPVGRRLASLAFLH